MIPGGPRKNIGNWIMIAGVYLLAVAAKGWTLEDGEPSMPGMLGGVATLYLGYRLQVWLEAR